MKLIEDNQLRLSHVVANNKMNRQRQLTGVNSYANEIGINIFDYLSKRIETGGETVLWLDICCGEGKALIECAQLLQETDYEKQVIIIGLDLVSMFEAYPRKDLSNLKLLECAIELWETDRQFDLITCVHGLHYVGDKLGVIKKVAALLKPSGKFVGHIDLNNLKNNSGKPIDKCIKDTWKSMGWIYNSKKHLLEIHGKSDWKSVGVYQGADDTAGPNYTGQEAVNSYYKLDG